MVTLSTQIKPTESTTTRSKTHQPPKDQKSHSMILRTSSAPRQKPYPKAIGDTPTPLDTPGNFQPEVTSQRRSYATILTLEAANNKIIPMGHEDDTWSPLASMALDRLQKLCV